MRIMSFLRRSCSFVQIDWSFIFLLGLACVLDSVKIYFLYLIFVVAHELCHLVIAKKLGYLPSKLKLTMFGASLEGYDDFLVGDEIKIILAGPLFNFFVVIFCYLSFWFYPESFEILNDVLVVNASILFFNMLPVFPLDAGRIVMCCASLKRGRKVGVMIAKRISFIIILILFCMSLFSFLFSFNFMLGFVSINLCVLLFDSSNGTSFKREIVFRNKLSRLNKGLVQKVIYVNELYPKELLLKYLDAEHYFMFIFVDKNFCEKERIDERMLLENLGFI